MSLTPRPPVDDSSVSVAPERDPLPQEIPPGAPESLTANEQPLRPPKRRRGDESRASYPRRRALVACEICRKRKSKCDSARPSCGACQDLNITCVYRDGKSDHSTYDLASLEILERVNYAVELLEKAYRGQAPAGVSAVHSPCNQQPVSSPSTHIFSQPTLSHQYPSPRFHRLSNENEIHDEASVLAESLEFSEKSVGKCEDILEWPIFQGRFSRSDTETLILNPSLCCGSEKDPYTQFQLDQSVEDDRVRRPCASAGVQESDALELVGQFLAKVHIKNPILDGCVIRRRAKDVMENGFRWDGNSCLVLIACALGSISSPYSPECLTPATATKGGSVGDVENYTTAECYYVAARKRLGLLENSILATQCYFLSGVYEMYTLRPLRAWSSFNRACVMLQIYFRTRAGENNNENIERRLYWSCLKSECEIRMEIKLPPSGLAKLNYPDVFPTPPCSSPNPTRPKDTSSQSSQSNYEGGDLEKSWGYYLSDIAVRRIANRIVNSFYKEPESVWLSYPVERMIRVADELDLQLTQWQNYLPTIAIPSPSEPPSHHAAAAELRKLQQHRAIEFRERIYRPFLYIAIHRPADSPIQHTIEPYVKRCLDFCMQNACEGSHRHRHHGTWYRNREIFMECLLILAAVKSRHIQVPMGWRDIVVTCIAGLNFWAREAPDLGKAAEILQSILDCLDSKNWEIRA